MPISPRTESFMQPPPTIEDETRAFEDGFSQMAHRILEAKFPELIEHVVTFKILSTDLDTNSGVGAFVMSRGGDTLYIPIILANSKIKPVEVFFHKEKNVFLPLSEGWIGEIDRSSLNELGESVKPPKTLETDVDIRNLVLPPTAGRYSYAEEKGAALAGFLDKAPNRVKTAFKKILEKNKKVLKFAFENYNKDLILNSLRPHIEKKAVEVPKVHILTPENSSDDFKSIFGKDAAEAFQTAMKLGYIVRDTRPDNNIAVGTEEPVWLHEANENGFYQIKLSDGSVKKALVIADPQPLESMTVAGKLTSATRRSEESKKYRKKKQKDVLEDASGHVEGKESRYLIYTEDGKIFDTDFPPTGKMLTNEDMEIKDFPVAPGSQGFFMRMKGGRPTATRRFNVDTVSTGKDGVRRIVTTDDKTLVTDPKNAVDQIIAPQGSKTTYIPPTYKFVRGDFDVPVKLLRTSEENLRYTTELEKNGAFKVKVKDAGGDMYSISGLSPETKLAALRHLVLDMKIAAPDAQRILEKTAERGHYAFYLATIDQLTKYAQGMMMDPSMMQQGAPPPGAMPPGGAPPPAEGAMPPAEGMMPPEGMMPGMEGMMPGMAPPMPAPGPTPTEVAVTQMSAELAQEAAATTQQLQDRMSILSEVQQRADQIASEAAMSPEELAAQAEPPIDMAAGLGDYEAFEATAISALAANPDLRTVVSEYMPTLEQALDNLGRILLTLWMEEDSHRAELGEEDYIDLEEKLRNVFDNLGALILKINQTAMATEDAQKGTQS